MRVSGSSPGASNRMVLLAMRAGQLWSNSTRPFAFSLAGTQQPRPEYHRDGLGLDQGAAQISVFR